MLFSKSKLHDATRIALLSQRLQTMDGLLTVDGFQTFDQQTVDSTGAFLIGELERLDQRIHAPLAAYTYTRDIDFREDVSMADEFSSFMNSNFGAAGNVPGTGKSWLGKNANAIAGISLDLGKTAVPLTLWATQLGWTIPELESAQKLGRPVDVQKFDGMMLKYNMDVDEQVYLGDNALGLTGMLNHTSMSNISNAITGAWTAATASDLIIADVNELLNSVWAASGFAVCPDQLRLPPTKFALLQGKMANSAANISVLNWLRENSLSNSVNGRPLNIQPLKWCTGTNNGGRGPGAGGADRMIAYTKDPVRVRFPIVPLQRTPVEYRDLRQLTTYFGRLGAVELVYPETMGARDGI